MDLQDDQQSARTAYLRCSASCATAPPKPPPVAAGVAIVAPGCAAVNTTIYFPKDRIIIKAVSNGFVVLRKSEDFSSHQTRSPPL